MQKVLFSDLGGKRDDTREIAARTIKARQQAKLDRIIAHCKMIGMSGVAAWHPMPKCRSSRAAVSAKRSSGLLVGFSRA